MAEDEAAAQTEAVEAAAARREEAATARRAEAASAAAALAEASAAPRIGPEGEDRSGPAPREASGAGRRDDTHVRPAPALPPELPSDPELPEEDEFSVSPTGAGGGGTPVSTPTLCPRRLPAALSHVLCHSHQPVPGCL